MAGSADSERRETAAPSRREPTVDAAHEATPTGPGGLAMTPASPTATGSVGRLGVQAKSVVGAASDPLEQQADHAADRVMRALAPEATSAAAPAEPVVRRQPAAGAESTRPLAEHEPEPAQEGFDAELGASSGLGQELPAETRVAMETAFGKDLSMVRVHDDEAAHRAATSIGALAFTRGSDIYFASGAYDPIGEDGRRLLAHELAHVVQQGAAADGSPVRRKKGDKGGAAAPEEPKTETFTSERGTVDPPNKKVELIGVAIPKVKIATIGEPATVRNKAARQARPSTDSYTSIWSAAAKGAFDTQLTTFLGGTEGTTALGEKGAYYLTYSKNKPTASAKLAPLIGRREDLAEGLWRPRWEKGHGEFALFDIDHMKDWSMSGDNDIKNLWLLERTANQRLGGLVWDPVDKALDALLKEARPRLTKPPRTDTVDKSWTIVVKSWKDSGKAPPGHPDWNWSVADMGTAALLAYLHAVPVKRRSELTGSDTELAIYSRAYGASVRHLPVAKDGSVAVKSWGTPGLYRVTSVKMDKTGDDVVPGAPVGELVVEPFHGNRYVKGDPVPLPITGMAGVAHGGAISTESARARIHAHFEGASPIVWDALEFDVNTGFVARGVVRPDVEVLRNAEIAILVGDDLAVEAMLSASAITLPGPLQINSGLVLVRIGLKSGASVSGGFDLEVTDLARGAVRVDYAPDKGFGFDGELGSLPDKPYDAKVRVGYHEGAWSAAGSVSIGPNKVGGIKSGKAEVALAKDTISAQGTFESTFKGLTGGTLAFTQDPVTGTTVAGTLQLGKLPGIEGGEISAKVKQATAGSGWSLAGSVTARPAIPGVTGTIGGTYEDGAFVAIADLGYKRGMLDGKLRLGVTNRAVDASGVPAGPAVPDHMVVFGRGQLALQLTPWLIGTAIVEVRPNGTIAVAGRIGLPDHFTLFDRRELNRRIFSIGIDIPIVGIAVAGQRIGIFATVSGGLDLVAGIGPGQLLGTGITVTYDPDQEDATTLEGETHLAVPADAGLRLYIRGGVGAGIPLVSAEAGIELGAELGLAGQLTADAHLLWTRSAGLVFDAEAGLTVQPRFRFTADAYALVTIGIGWLSKDLVDEHWRLAAFEYGSDLRFGVFLPIHAEAGRFDFSFDRVRFEYPSIDPGDIAKGAIRHVVG